VEVRGSAKALPLPVPPGELGSGCALESALEQVLASKT
jgi:hypothetical protein